MRHSRTHSAWLGLLLLVLSGTFGAGRLQAQQEALYTQYLFSPLTINPAYAGSRDGFSLAGIYRRQWTGIDNAPQTANLAFHAPAGDRIGWGLQLIDDRLGISTETGAWGQFAFRIPAGTGELAIGLSAGASFYQISLGDGMITDPDDPVFQGGQQLWLPNVGAGIYYHTEKFYLGVAAPRLIDNRLRESSTAMSGAQVAQQFRHFNAMTGFVFPLGENIKLRPAGLLRIQQNQPVQTEASLDALFLNRFWLGAGYRSGGSVDAHFVLHIGETLRLGYAYDWVVNELGIQTGGSHEVLLGLDFGSRRVPVSSPRQFVPQYF